MRDLKLLAPVRTAVRWLEREAHRVRAQARKTLLHLRLGNDWRTDEAATEFSRRSYPDYESYLAHQRLKLDALRHSSLERHDRRFYAALCERLARLPIALTGLRVLCLAARQGTEVRAFIDAHAFAVGIDLNPGPNNRFVLTGDFHALQFGTGTVDLVYTNSLDHAFELDRVLSEVRRVLIADGLLLLEAGYAAERGGAYESLSWSSMAALLERVAAHGFQVVHRAPFAAPWPGEAILLRRVPAQ